jgi:uncharacterized protein (UPF0335 family)
MTVNNNEYLKEFIKSLEWFKKKKRTLEQGKQKIFKDTSYRNIHIRTFHNYDRHNYFRARSLGEKEDETSIRAHSYPPKEYNKIGRCNLKSEPVLYASLDPATALYEYLNTGKAGDIVHISVWKLKENTSIPTFNIMPNPNLIQKNIETGEIINISKTKMDKMFDLIIELFNNSKLYEFSAPFCYFLLYQTEICKMIQYPSVTTQQSECLAIQSNFFDENFYLSKVYRLQVFEKIERLDNKKNKIKALILNGLIVGNINNGKIVYEEPNEEDMELWNFYKEEMNEDNRWNLIE